MFGLGEGLVGQAALERKSIVVTQAPEDYIAIASGLGEADAGQHRRPPRPLRGPGDGGDRDGVVRAVLRGAPDVPRAARRRRSASSLNTIVATMRTEELLQQSQGLTHGAAEPVGGAAVAARRARADEPGARGAGAVAEGVRGAAPAAAGGAAADERGARGEGGSCSPSRTRASSRRTPRSRRRGSSSRTRPSSSRSPRSTRASSSRT